MHDPRWPAGVAKRPWVKHTRCQALYVRESLLALQIEARHALLGHFEGPRVQSEVWLLRGRVLPLEDGKLVFEAVRPLERLELRHGTHRALALTIAEVTPERWVRHVPDAALLRGN